MNPGCLRVRAFGVQFDAGAAEFYEGEQRHLGMLAAPSERIRLAPKSAHVWWGGSQYGVCWRGLLVGVARPTQ